MKRVGGCGHRCARGFDGCRGALRLLRDSFATVKEQELAAKGDAEGAAEDGAAPVPALSLKGIVEGSSRKEAARMFFETLVSALRNL